MNRASAVGASDDHVIVRRVRHCIPYETTSTHIVKEKYAGLQAAALLQVIIGAHANFWASEIRAGRVTITRACPNSADGCLHAGDGMTVTRHIHEQAVLATDLPHILYEDDDLLVVDKPAGVPTIDDVPGVGRNTCVGLTQAAFDAREVGDNDATAAPLARCQLVPCHRLDKPVSGVLLLAKNRRKKHNLAARRVARQVQKEGGVSKVYVARVVGAFPTEPLLCELPLLWSQAEHRACVDATGGKTSSTRFTLLRRGRTTSLVQCEPITGRSHQIRAHLCALGHPVANDAKYLGGATPAVGPGEPTADELCIFADDESCALARMFARARVDWCETCTRRAAVLQRPPAAPAVTPADFDGAADVAVGEAARPSRDGEQVHAALGIWLHSLRYVIPGLGLRFESPSPKFACEDFDVV